MDAASEPLILNFSDHVHVSGELLTGSVSLNVDLAQAQKIDSVLVKIRGLQKTWVLVGQVNYIQHVSLVKMDQAVWSSSNDTHPDARSRTIHFPFSFQLPKDLPPSFYYMGAGYSSEITYSIEVVGHRAGLLHRNRRVGKIFPLVPAANIRGEPAIVGLLEGWKGRWKTITTGDEIRQGLWGRYSKIDVELVIPDLESFPIGIPVPFRLRVATTTKPMERSELDEQLSEGKEVFPAPPTTPTSIRLQIDKKVKVKAQYMPRESHRIEGNNLISNNPSAYNFVQERPEWIPSSSKKEDAVGVWRRSIRLESSFVFAGSPSFKTETTSCAYTLHLRVPFPGMRNDLKYDLPVTVDSGMICPEPSFNHGTSRSSSFSSAVMDLPSSYWEGKGYDWDSDGK